MFDGSTKMTHLCRKGKKRYFIPRIKGKKTETHPGKGGKRARIERRKKSLVVGGKKMNNPWVQD